MRWRKFLFPGSSRAFIKLKGQCRRIKDGQETKGLLSVPFNCKFSFFLLSGRKDTESHNKGKETKMHVYFNPSLYFIPHYAQRVVIYTFISTNLQTVSATISSTLGNNGEPVQPIFPCVCTNCMSAHVCLGAARA